MPANKENNYAFIDGQNLNLGIRELGWSLDYRRFRQYLADKYGVQTAYYCIGLVPGNQSLYNMLQKAGYVLVFKPTIIDVHGKTKGNVDAELVLQTMIDYVNYDKAVIVSSDGDFHCLVQYLEQNGKLKRVLSPNEQGCSTLLQKVSKGNIDYLENHKNKLQFIPQTHR